MDLKKQANPKHTFLIGNQDHQLLKKDGRVGCHYIVMGIFSRILQIILTKAAEIPPLMLFSLEVLQNYNILF